MVKVNQQFRSSARDEQYLIIFRAHFWEHQISDSRFKDITVLAQKSTISPLTNQRVALVGALFPLEFFLNLKVLTNRFISSYKELRIFHQFVVL